MSRNTLMASSPRPFLPSPAITVFQQNQGHAELAENDRVRLSWLPEDTVTIRD
jgi:hypothetical protein